MQNGNKKNLKRRKKSEADALFRLWCKVNELKLEKCTVAQISRETELDRKTVKKYLEISSLDKALAYFGVPRRRASPKMAALQEYEDFFRKELENPAGLSYAQIMDHFQEKYPNAPRVSKSTLEHYLDSLRKKEGIPTVSKYSRTYRKRVPKGWGQEAEVDFGEMDLVDADGITHHVHFILVVLKASCYKFVYFIEKKFDSAHAVFGLHKAFEYFDGVPIKVIFDQDRVWLVDENLGHYILTQLLADFVKDVGFEPVFCRAYDPESKGRVERYVGFVKKNFLRGREFVDCRTLNEQALAWLKRTGNGKMHDSFYESPRELFKEEKKYLNPYNHKVKDPDWTPEERRVTKDNTVKYQGSIFDVPPGTYQGPGTMVLVDDRSNPGYVLIMDILRRVIVQYPKTDKEHMHFTLPEEMLKEKPCRNEKALREKLDQWDDGEPLSRLVRDIKEKEGRYYKDVLRELNKIVSTLDLSDSMCLIKHCADNHLTRVSQIMGAKEQLHLGKEGPGEDNGQLGRYDDPDYDPDSPTLDIYN